MDIALKGIWYAADTVAAATTILGIIIIICRVVQNVAETLISNASCVTHVGDIQPDERNHLEHRLHKGPRPSELKFD